MADPPHQDVLERCMPPNKLMLLKNHTRPETMLSQ
jgi:hypothetical protein